MLARGLIHCRQYPENFPAVLPLGDARQRYRVVGAGVVLGAVTAELLQVLAVRRVNVVLHPRLWDDVELGVLLAKVDKHPIVRLDLGRFLLLPPGRARLPCPAGLGLDLNADDAVVAGIAGQEVDVVHVAREGDRVATASVNLSGDEVLSRRADLLVGELGSPRCGCHAQTVARMTAPASHDP